MARKKFPNGFESWMETFFEVTSAIALELVKDEDTLSSTVVKEWYESQGSCGMCSLAEQLTDKFEKKYKGRFWDGDWFDTIDNFIKEELA